MRRSAELVSATFEDELLKTFPGIAADLRALKDYWEPDEPGLYAIVGEVLTPYVERAADSEDPYQLKRACLFMERMATSPDVDLPNALQVGLLEVLGDDRERLERARRVMR